LSGAGRQWVPAAVAAQGYDELWEISSKMEMPGMRMTMTRTNDTMNMAVSGKRVGDCTAPTK
jgi:hypothetical protein